LDFAVSGVKVHDNIIASSNGWVGICFGGYDGNLGYTYDCEIYNNILYGNVAGIGVQKSYGNTIRNNIICGGEAAIEFMDEIDSKSRDFDKKKLKGLPGDNNFLNNLWHNIDSDEWDYGLNLLKKVAPNQYESQVLLTVSPLAELDNGAFQVVEEYKPDYGTDFLTWSDWTHGSEIFWQYSEFLKAHDEAERAAEFLQDLSISFSNITEDNLRDYLTKQLQEAGFNNSEVRFVLQTGSGKNAKLADKSGIVELLVDRYDEKNDQYLLSGLDTNGFIDRDKLQKSAGNKFTYLCEIITRYGEDSYAQALTYKGVILNK
jgi:parallel beta-helix repeat protein